MDFSEPLGLAIDEVGRLSPATSGVVRRLSDMRGMYADQAAESRLIDAGDALVYEVFQWDVPPVIGELFVCTTILQPGRVGDEYFMTKGHFHQRRDRGEVYYGLSGRGSVLMMKDDRVESVPIGPREVAYVPPFWAHRTVNTGDEPLVFLAVYPGDAGHDYGSIETSGFAGLLVDRNGEPTLIANNR
jgi:glucose-6-phosphate isomerase, archaeal